MNAPFVSDSQWASYYGGYQDYSVQQYHGYSDHSYQGYNGFHDPQYAQWAGYSTAPEVYGTQTQPHAVQGQAYVPQPQQAHGYPQYPPPETPATFVPASEAQPPLPAEAAPPPAPPLPPPPPPPPPLAGNKNQEPAVVPESGDKMSTHLLSPPPKVRNGHARLWCQRIPRSC